MTASILNFDYAERVGDEGEITEESSGFGEDDIEFPVSLTPRGLALQSLLVTKNWDGLWGWLRKRQQIYFITTAVDLSGRPPVVMPPRDLALDVINTVKPGEEISFSLGEGAPIFPARTIVGGLVVYLIICEADGGVRHIGETMAKIHADLTANDGAILQKIIALVKNPAKTLADEALAAASAVLQPIATTLAQTKDDSVGALQGIFKADNSWDGKLEQKWSGGRIVLKEL